MKYPEAPDSEEDSLAERRKKKAAKDKKPSPPKEDASQPENANTPRFAVSKVLLSSDTASVMFKIAVLVQTQIFQHSLAATDPADVDEE